MILINKHKVVIFSPNCHHARSDAPDEHSYRLHAQTYPQTTVDKRETLILTLSYEQFVSNLKSLGPHFDNGASPALPQSIINHRWRGQFKMTNYCTI